MSRQQDRRHGTMQLEDVIRAFHGLHDALAVEPAAEMSASQRENMWFLMKELLQRLEDIFDVIVHEQVGHG